MNKIIICRYCKKPEYYDKMRWLSGMHLCRDCYRAEYESERGVYIWNDLDGERPTMDAFEAQFLNKKEQK